MAEPQGFSTEEEEPQFGVSPNFGPPRPEPPGFSTVEPEKVFPRTIQAPVPGTNQTIDIELVAPGQRTKPEVAGAAGEPGFVGLDPNSMGFPVEDPTIPEMPISPSIPVIAQAVGGLAGFIGETPEPTGSPTPKELVAGRLLTTDPLELTKIAQKSIKGSQIEQDQFGNPVIRMPDGRLFYAKSPVASAATGVNLAAQGAASLAGFGIAGKLLPGASNFVRGALAEGALGLADVAGTEALGGEPPLSKFITQPLLMATLGGGFAKFGPVVGRMLSDEVFVNHIVTRGIRLVDDKGRITLAAREAMRRMDIDPKTFTAAEMRQMEQEMVRQIGAEGAGRLGESRVKRNFGGGTQGQIAEAPTQLTKPGMTAEEAFQVTVDRQLQQDTRIPVTKGELTGVPTQLSAEAELRGRFDPGVRGGAGAKIITEFDQVQARRVEDAVRRARGRSQPRADRDIATGIREAADAERAEAERVFDLAGETGPQGVLRFSGDNYRSAANAITRKSSFNEISQTTSPLAMRAREILKKSAAGQRPTTTVFQRPGTNQPPVQGPSRPIDVNELNKVRRQLSVLQRDARSAAKLSGRGNDEANMNKIVREYDEFIDRQINNSLFAGDEAQIANFKSARQLWGRFKNFYENSENFAGNIIRQMQEDGASSAEVTNALFAGNKVVPKKGATKAARMIRDRFGPKSDVWKSIQAATRFRLFEDHIRGGNITSNASTISTGLRKQLTQEKSRDMLIEVLGEAEVKKLDKLTTRLAQVGRKQGAIADREGDALLRRFLKNTMFRAGAIGLGGGVAAAGGAEPSNVAIGGTIIFGLTELARVIREPLLARAAAKRATGAGVGPVVRGVRTPGGRGAAGGAATGGLLGVTVDEFGRGLLE